MQSSGKAMSEARHGILFGLAAYLLWGFAPLYFKAMDFIDSNEIVAHRIVWTTVFTLLLTRRITHLFALLRQPRILAGLLATSVLISGNWLLFIWAVQHDHMLESSLGYFINPLLTVALSMVFLGERFRPMQWWAIALAALAIALPLWRFGSVPWIALGLATSFACYGLIRKKLHVASLPGLCLETMFALPLAWYLFATIGTPTVRMWDNPLWLNLSLAAAGIVTMVPLLCYAAAATRIRLSTLGMMQYIGPSIIFLVAIFGFGEELSRQQLVSFSLVWLALLIYSLDALRHRIKRQN